MHGNMASASPHLKTLLRLASTIVSGAGRPDVRAIYVPQVGGSAGDVLQAHIRGHAIECERLAEAEPDFGFLMDRIAPPSQHRLQATAFMSGRFGSPIGIVRVSADDLPEGASEILKEQVDLFTDHIAFEKTSGVFEAISTNADFLTNYDSLAEVADTVCSVLRKALYCQVAYGWQVHDDFLTSFGTTNLSMSIGDGLAGLVAQTGKMIVAHDILNTKENVRRFGRDIRHRSIIEKMKVNDAIFLPIAADTGKTLAVFAIYFKRRGGATSLDQELASYIVSHFASYFHFNKELSRLRGVEQRLIGKSPYINSVISVLSDMHDLQNHIRGVENELSRADGSSSSRTEAALKMTQNALALLKRRREWMTLPASKEAANSVILAPDRQFVRLVVRDLVESAAQVFFVELARDRIELVNSVLPTMRIKGFSGALRRAIENLISNSVKILRIRSGPKRIVVGARLLLNGGAEIYVEDNGGGILPDDEKHMYEMLYSSWGQAGMGLGLTIVRSAAELHGGTLRHTNRPGRGAEFRIVLPESSVLHR